MSEMEMNQGIHLLLIPSFGRNWASVFGLQCFFKFALQADTQLNTLLRQKWQLFVNYNRKKTRSN